MMELRTIYAAFCAIIGAMVGAVLAALVMLLFAILALLGNGLPAAARLLGYALMATVFIVPVIAGAYAGIRWARRVEKKNDIDLAAEKSKGYAFLAFSVIIAILLIIVSILR
jgi:hypothetical protein